MWSVLYWRICWTWQYRNWQHQYYRSSRPEMFCKKDILKNFAKSRGKYLCHSLFFNKVTGWALFKKRVWHRCFPVNFAKFLRTPFHIEHLLWLLLILAWWETWGLVMRTMTILLTYFQNSNIEKRCNLQLFYSSKVLIKTPGKNNALTHFNKNCSYSVCLVKLSTSNLARSCISHQTNCLKIIWIFGLNEKRERKNIRNNIKK